MMPVYRRRLALCLCLPIIMAGCSRSKTEHSGVVVAEEALRNGSPVLALQIAQNILAKSPDDVPALLIRGDASMQLGKSYDAEAAFLLALRLQPGSARGQMGLGRLRLATDATEAAALFQDAVRQEPRNLIALNNLGIARDLLGQHRQAQESYRGVRAIDPGNAPAQVNLALSLAMSGQAAEALALIAPLANEPASSVKVRHDYAAVLALAGREDEAETILGRDLPPREIRTFINALREHRNHAP